MEIEYKFKINSEQLVQLKNHPILQTGQAPVFQKIENVYFDTVDFQLQKKHIILRIRKIGKQYFQTLKFSNVTQNGLSRREEIEFSISRARFDLSLFSDKVKQLLPDIDDLKPVFMVSFDRTIYLLHSNHNLVIELAIDQGNIIVGKKILPISELELELKEGTEKAFMIFAEKLQSDLVLIPENRSKSERGFSLLTKN